MFLDSGEQFSLDEEDGGPEGPHYRQIWVNEPTHTSRHLAFDVNVGSEHVRFTLPNPAYRP